uniref:Uncharacterized protein n=1 Tax=Hemiselmis tepida TaxID=464990 RepID=A0A7S0Z2M4_9CRYP
MGDAEEIVDLFVRYPRGLSDQELKQYDDLFHDKFRAEIPNSAIKGEVGGTTQMKASEWLTMLKALVKGMPDWQWHGNVWRPVEELEGWEDVVEDGQNVRRVHFTTRIEATHTGDGPNTLRMDGVDHKPSGKKVVFPTEWWTLSINDKIPPKIVKLQWVKVLDLAGCSTGGYSMIPGILFALGKPLPPVPQALEYPYPPYPPADAVDMEDPNWWSLRLEIFRKLKNMDDPSKEEMKRLLDRQLAELQQHQDYLVSLEHYTEKGKENPHQKPHFSFPPSDNGGKKPP